MTTESPNEVRQEEATAAGNYFVSNYPPYSFWTRDHVGEAYAALDRPPAPDTPLGIYLHIPFCRKRCHFCYFKVYTDKDAGEIEGYLDAAIQELALYAQKPFIGGRKPKFIYFGGGTPSYISSRQITYVVNGMKQLLPWDEAEEVTFECEPGTLTEGKLSAIRDLGVTRLSLGIENFDDQILQINGRAHGSKEIDRAYQFARSIGFPQINIDLIAGMMGETTENWRDCVSKTIALAPDSVTIYQMEIPYNTTIFKEMKIVGPNRGAGGRLADQARVGGLRLRGIRKGRLHHHQRLHRGERSRAHPLPLPRPAVDGRGHDRPGRGVVLTCWRNAFSKRARIRVLYRQTAPGRTADLSRLDHHRGRAHDSRAHPANEAGTRSPRYFQDKFGVDMQQRFAAPLGKLQDQGFLTADQDSLRLNRDGLLQVDKLLHEFFLPQHQSARYA